MKLLDLLENQKEFNLKLSARKLAQALPNVKVSVVTNLNHPRLKNYLELLARSEVAVGVRDNGVLIKSGALQKINMTAVNYLIAEHGALILKIVDKMLVMAPLFTDNKGHVYYTIPFSLELFEGYDKYCNEWARQYFLKNTVLLTYPDKKRECKFVQFPLNKNAIAGLRMAFQFIEHPVNDFVEGIVDKITGVFKNDKNRFVGLVPSPRGRGVALAVRIAATRYLKVTIYYEAKNSVVTPVAFDAGFWIIDRIGTPISGSLTDVTDHIIKQVEALATARRAVNHGWKNEAEKTLRSLNTYGVYNNQDGVETLLYQSSKISVANVQVKSPFFTTIDFYRSFVETPNNIDIVKRVAKSVFEDKYGLRVKLKFDNIYNKIELFPSADYVDRDPYKDFKPALKNTRTRYFQALERGLLEFRDALLAQIGFEED